MESIGEGKWREPGSGRLDDGSGRQIEDASWLDAKSCTFRDGSDDRRRVVERGQGKSQKKRQKMEVNRGRYKRKGV